MYWYLGIQRQNILAGTKQVFRVKYGQKLYRSRTNGNHLCSLARGEYVWGVDFDQIGGFVAAAELECEKARSAAAVGRVKRLQHDMNAAALR